MCLKLNVPSYDFTDGLTDFNRLILISAYRLHSSGIAAPPLHLQPSHIDPALVLGPHHNPQELSQTPQIKKFLFCLYFWFLNKNFHFNGFRACPVVLLIPTSHILFNLWAVFASCDNGLGDTLRGHCRIWLMSNSCSKGYTYCVAVLMRTQIQDFFFFKGFDKRCYNMQTQLG